MAKKKNAAKVAATAPGAKKLAKTAVQRLDGLEFEVIPTVISKVNEALENIDSNFQGLKAQVDALVRIVGDEKVADTIKQMRAEEDAASCEKMESILKNFVEDGSLKPVEKIGERSLIVGREFDEEGEVRRPGRVQLAYSSIKPQHQEKILGQGVGFMFDTEIGGKFEILEVYEIVPKEERPDHECADADCCDTDDASDKE